MKAHTKFSQPQIYSKLSLLNSEPLKQELLSYIDYLLNKQFATRDKRHKPKFGCARVHLY